MSTEESLRDDHKTWMKWNNNPTPEDDLEPKMIALACRLSESDFHRRARSFDDRLRKEFLKGWEACEKYNCIGENDEK